MRQPRKLFASRKPPHIRGIAFLGDLIQLIRCVWMPPPSPATRLSFVKETKGWTATARCSLQARPLVSEVGFGAQSIWWCRKGNIYPMDKMSGPDNAFGSACDLNVISLKAAKTMIGFENWKGHGKSAPSILPALTSPTVVSTGGVCLLRFAFW